MNCILMKIYAPYLLVEFLGCQDYDLSEHNLDAFVRSPFDWRIVVVGSTPQEKNQGFYLCKLLMVERSEIFESKYCNCSGQLYFTVCEF